MKINKKGFVLIETLIVSVFVLAIFSVIYINFFPLIGEYERIENYDDLDSKYTAHWMRMFIINKRNRYDQNNNLLALDATDNLLNLNLGNNTYRLLTQTDCDSNLFTDADICARFFEGFNVNKIFLIDYNATKFKEEVKEHTNDYGLDTELINYINYMPTYKNSATTVGGSIKKRIIVEIEHNNMGTTDYYKSFANIEVVE